MTGTTSGDGAPRAPLSQPIIGWALLATLIAAALSAGIAFLLGDETASAEVYRTRGSDYADLVDVLLMLAVCITVSIGVWLAFHLLLFRKRAKLWKSVIALVVILPVVIFTGFIARAGTIVSHFEQDRAALRQIRSSLNQRLAAMRAETADQDEALRANAGFPAISRDADIVVALEAIRTQRDRIRAFELEADTEIERAREEMLALDVYEGERVEFIQQLDAILAPNSATHRLFDLEISLLDKQEEAMLLLVRRRSTWAFHQGEIQFHDRDAVHDMNEFTRQAHDLMRQIDIIEANGGEGVPRAAPDPPPR